MYPLQVRTLSQPGPYVSEPSACPPFRVGIASTRSVDLKDPRISFFQSLRVTRGWLAYLNRSSNWYSMPNTPLHPLHKQQ
jgi:hypothetical protein